MDSSPAGTPGSKDQPNISPSNPQDQGSVNSEDPQLNTQESSSTALSQNQSITPNPALSQSEDSEPASESGNGTTLSAESQSDQSIGDSQSPLVVSTETQVQQNSIIPPEANSNYSPIQTSEMFQKDNPASSSNIVIGSGKKNKKTLILSITAVLTILLLSGGFVFGYYLPNQPQNVWKTGLNRTGYALDKIVNSVTEADQLEIYKNSEVTASVDATYGPDKYIASASTRFNPSKTDGSIKVTANTELDGEMTLDIAFLSDLAEGAVFPDIFIKASGLNELAALSPIPSLEKYDDKWIVIGSEYLESIGFQPATLEQNEQRQINAGDIAELARVTTATLVEYVFTTDEQKAVFEQKRFIGKETVDNIGTYRYEVGINKQHAIDFCQTLTNKFFETSIYKKLSAEDDTQDQEEQKKQSLESCDTELESEIKENESFDMWIDGKYKMIHKVRTTDPDDSEQYTEVGQVYKGGDEFTLFVNSNSKTSQSKFTLTTNFKTAQTKVTFTSNGGEDDYGYSVDGRAEANPYKGDLTIDRPEGAIPIDELLNSLGNGYLGDDESTSIRSSGVGSRANDTERQTDIKAIRGWVEAYYAQNGRYPTLANINDANWRFANMAGLDTEALKDPEGLSATLGSVSGANVYSYKVAKTGGGSCDNVVNDCQEYVLSATLSDGGIYEKKNLN